MLRQGSAIKRQCSSRHQLAARLTGQCPPTGKRQVAATHQRAPQRHAIGLNVCLATNTPRAGQLQLAGTQLKRAATADATASLPAGTAQHNLIALQLAMVLHRTTGIDRQVATAGQFAATGQCAGIQQHPLPLQVTVQGDGLTLQRQRAIGHGTAAVR